MEWTIDKKLGSVWMQTVKTLAIPAKGPNRAIFSTSTVYCSREGEALLQEYSEIVASDTFGEMYQRTSLDNGKTWSPEVCSYTPYSTPEGVIRRGESVLFREDQSGDIIRFFNLHCYPGGTHTSAVFGLTEIWYEVSRDEGETFVPPMQIIVEGGTKKHWAPDVEYGVNSMMISFCAPFVDRQGRIILPAHFIPPQQPGQSKYAVVMEAGCFIGTRGESGEYWWQIGSRVALDSSQSFRGAFEPAIAELEDGAFLMICRASNANMPGTAGRKWISLSHDGGRSWSRPSPFLFDDGAPFFSPSSGSRLIRHSRNGALYWIGNISAENPNGNGPRYPLWIGMVNEEGQLVKASLRKIDDRMPGESDRVQLSNFRVYEDRITGEIVVHLARILENGCDLTSPAYEYRIGV